MLRTILLALTLAAGASSAAQAQTALVVPSCVATGVNSPLGPGGVLVRDQAGNICMSSGSGSGQAAAATSNAGGVSNFSRIPSSAATNNLTLAKTGATRSYVYHGCNTTASTIYLRLYNVASAGAVTVGTTVPFAGPYAFPANTCLPATSFADDLGISLTAGLAYAFGTSPLDTDTTAIGAGAITAFQIGYQ